MACAAPGSPTLFVIESARGHGSGHQLVSAVARAATEGGAKSLSWAVCSANRAARAFYQQLGARDEDTRLLEFDGDALSRLADAADQPK